MRSTRALIDGGFPRVGRVVAIAWMVVMPFAQMGCFGKHRGPWREATAQDVEVLREHYHVDVGDRTVLRRDVSVWFIGPASGYPEWAVRDADGVVTVVAPRDAAGR